MSELIEKQIERLQKMIDDGIDIVFFGGAGVSTESGIPDFRSSTGIFTNNLSAETIISHDYFYYNPKEFYRFYKDKMMYTKAEPNICHKKLAELEKAGKHITIITQNIDGLHQKAGSKNVIELHGSIYKNHCIACGKNFDANFVKNSDGVPTCPRCGSIIKPDVVLYGEPLSEETVNKAVAALEKADLLIVGGTSLKVYPAASFIHVFRGDNKVYINMENEQLSDDFIFIKSKLGDVFSQIKVNK